MLKLSVVWRESGALRRRLKDVASQIDPRSPRMDRFRTEIKKIAVEDNTEKVLGYGSGLAGVDRFGRPLAPLGQWAYGAAFRRRGNGPVLAPHGLASRVITNFRVVWQWSGKQYQMIAGWDGIPWIIHHLRGCPKGSNTKRPNWSLPKRDISGLGPRTRTKIAAAFSGLAKSILRKGTS